MPETSTTIRLPSGPEMKLVIIRHDPPNDRWMASMVLTTSFHSTDIEQAQECAFPAMIAVVEKALADLRDLEDDLRSRLSLT